MLLLSAGVIFWSSYAAAVAPGRSIVSVIPVTKRCPSSLFEIGQGDMCIYQDRKEATLVCRHGKLVNNVCKTEEWFPAELQCPEGLTYNGSGCELNQIKPATFTCDTGDSLINGECLRVESLPTKVTCPRGYELGSAGRCETQTMTSPDYQCGPGFKSMLEEEERLCERINVEEPKSNCPAGTFLHDRMCISSTIEGPVNKRCASGGDMDASGKCVSVASVDADIVCATGYVFNSGKCEKPVFSAPSLRCPKDFVLHGEQCVLTIAAEPFCDSANGTLTSTGKCVGIQQADPLRACPQRSVPGTEGRCMVQVVYENDLKYECTENYSYVEGRCLKRVRTALAQSCPSKYTLNPALNMCEQRERVGATAKCAGEAVLDKISGSCVTLSSSEPVISCPRNSEYDPITQSCRTKRNYPAEAICPEGMSLKKAVGGGRLSAGVECVLQKVVPAQFNCGGSGELGAKGMCSRGVTSPPSLQCGEIYELIDDQCVHIEQIAATKTCPPEFKHVGNACVGKIPSPDSDQLSGEDRDRLQEVIESFGVSAGSKKPAVLRRTGDKELGLVGLAESANRASLAASESRHVGKSISLARATKSQK